MGQEPEMSFKGLLNSRRVSSLWDEQGRQDFTDVEAWLHAIESGHAAYHALNETGEEAAIDQLVQLAIPVPANLAAAERTLANMLIERSDRRNIVTVAYSIGFLLHTMSDYNERTMRQAQQVAPELVAQLRAALGADELKPQGVIAPMGFFGKLPKFEA